MNLQKLEIAGAPTQGNPPRTYLPWGESTWIVFIQAFSLFCTSNIVLNSFTLKGKQESDIDLD